MADRPSYVYVTYIESSPERVWEALTDPDLTAQYWGHSNVSDWQAARRGSTGASTARASPMWPAPCWSRCRPVGSR